MRITLDTNILLYAVDRDSGARHAIARQVIDLAGQAECVLTLQTLGEFFQASTRKNHLRPERAMEFTEAFAERFPVREANSACLSMAMQATGSHNLSFWEAMLWATAQQAGCRLILSEDGQDGRLLGGVSYLNPFRPNGVKDAALRLGLR